MMNLSRVIEKPKQMNILEIKFTTSQLQNSVKGLKIRLSMVKGRINEHENRIMYITYFDKREKKKRLNREHQWRFTQYKWRSRKQKMGQIFFQELVVTVSRSQKKYTRNSKYSKSSLTLILSHRNSSKAICQILNLFLIRVQV